MTVTIEQLQRIMPDKIILYLTDDTATLTGLDFTTEPLSPAQQKAKDNIEYAITYADEVIASLNLIDSNTAYLDMLAAEIAASKLYDRRPACQDENVRAMKKKIQSALESFKTPQQSSQIKHVTGVSTTNARVFSRETLKGF